MVMGGIVDELAATDVHASVSDLVGTGTEKQKIAGLKIFAIDFLYSAPRGLKVGVTRHIGATATN